VPRPTSRLARPLVITAALALAALALTAPIAGAQGQGGANSAGDVVYSQNEGGGGGGENIADPGGSPSTDPGSGSGLPFTGLIAPILLGVGVAALAVGLVVRRTTTSRA
jgi:hypothetical protein